MPWEWRWILTHSRLGSGSASDTQWISVCSMVRFDTKVWNHTGELQMSHSPLDWSSGQGIGAGPCWFMCPLYFLGHKSHTPNTCWTGFGVSRARLFFEWDGDAHCAYADRWQLKFHCAGRTENRTGPRGAGARWCRFGHIWRSFLPVLKWRWRTVETCDVFRCVVLVGQMCGYSCFRLCCLHRAPWLQDCHQKHVLKDMSWWLDVSFALQPKAPRLKIESWIFLHEFVNIMIEYTVTIIDIVK